MNEIPSPSGRLAWYLVLASVAATLLAALVGGWPAGESESLNLVRQGVASALLLTAWIALARFLVIDTWMPRVLAVVLLLCGALTLLGTPGMVVAISLTSPVLTFRKYMPWRHIPARLRALGFGLGVVAIVLLFVAQRSWGLAEPSGAAAMLRRLAGWSFASLLLFWAWSLFHLAIRMRLHFMNLRPKLTVHSLLIGLVPLLLVGLLGVAATYLGLGGARAVRATNILEDWRQTTAAGVDLSGAVFDTTFAWPVGVEAPARGTRIEAPAWTPELAHAMWYTLIREPEVEGRPVPARVDTTGWYAMGGHLWLMDWKGIGTEQPTVRAWLLGDRPLTRLSDLLKAGVSLSAVDVEETESSTQIGPADDEQRERFGGSRAMYREVEDAEWFWREAHFFGATLWNVSTVQDDMLDSDSIFISLRADWQDLRSEFMVGESKVNAGVLGALIAFAVLLLIIEIFAVFFGARIAEGIIAAVHTLKRGTRALAAGDLDTIIDLPNEDEFGDLADSFNEMTRAVKKGREDALARQALTRELANARAIQKRLLPAEEPRVAGFEVAGASVPSREIGGDYFDFLLQGEDHLGVAIGDVSGKGMPAALLMSNLQAGLHGQVLHPSSVADIVSRVNDLMVAATDPHMFATFFYGVLDLNAGTFTSTNAGHNPPLVLRKSGELEQLQLGGLLIGMLAGQTYKQQVTELAPGEVVVLYTDGITEAVGPSAEEDDPEAMFGEEALAEVVRRSAHLPAVGIKEAILDAVREHTRGVPQSDDITLVVIRRQG